MATYTATISSNLTYSDGVGSTVTSASTSDTLAGSNAFVEYASGATSPVSLQTNSHNLVAQTVAAGNGSTGWTTVNIVNVNPANEYLVRLRNLGRASGGLQPSSGTPAFGIDVIEIALQTAANTYVPLGRIYQTEIWGPVRMIPQPSGSSYPKLVARSTVTGANYSSTTPQGQTLVLETISADAGTPGSY